jgi:glyoxylase-like metal-dependent hydrolase (beta-lactamase superfamily II)
MKIQFLGAARTVTGSMHLLTVNGHRLLLDCGLFQGRRAEAWERNRHFPFSVADLDAVILSHAYIDHSGNLPSLAKTLNSLDGPAIIISASGMCEAGRILHHLRHHIEDPRACVLSLGRGIAARTGLAPGDRAGARARGRTVTARRRRRKALKASENLQGFLRLDAPVLPIGDLVIQWDDLKPRVAGLEGDKAAIREKVSGVLVG